MRTVILPLRTPSPRVWSLRKSIGSSRRCSVELVLIGTSPDRRACQESSGMLDSTGSAGLGADAREEQQFGVHLQSLTISSEPDVKKTARSRLRGGPENLVPGLQPFMEIRFQGFPPNQSPAPVR